MATATEASMDVGGQDNMDLILQLPMAAAFAMLVRPGWQHTCVIASSSSAYSYSCIP